jgi:hypothetical protein
VALARSCSSAAGSYRAAIARRMLKRIVAAVLGAGGALNGLFMLIDGAR